ncbi:spore cortex-lytic enzyme [Desulfofalx alkaliphila]|uniref:spore cortex-lytic enzyme n=1 Tax=Desulfofalx alkaliphila TaxID=105483 RepID=UPI0004E1CA80|nr:spore cortex-lytic enzyme [Desulfofalx alkaliphila]
MLKKDKSRRKPAAMLILVAFLVAAVGTFAFSKADAQPRTLYWGISGDDVRHVQIRLSDWDYYDGPIDGVYNPQTFNAVKNFQAKNGLAVDGVVGPRTWAAIGYPPAGGSAPQQQAAQNQPTQQRDDRNEVASRAEVNRADLHLLSRVVMGEAADEPYVGQVAVAAVILNRVESPNFPNTLAGVVYQPLAFESVANAQYTREVSDEARRAAEDAMNGWDPTGGALFFWNPYKPVSKWIWSRTITGQIGNHVFGI